MSEKIVKHLRPEQMPTPFCSGCGHGIVAGAILHAIEELGWSMDEMCFISGTGHAGRISNPLFNADAVQVNFGRALAFATGVKLANPVLRVVVVTGEGDLISGGAAHFVHAAKRNVDILCVCSNNYILGAGDGAASPTTPIGAITSTTPAGNHERPLDLCKIAHAAGASYIARYSTYHVRPLVRALKVAFNTKGFSFVDVLSPCPVEYGQKNGMPTGSEVMNLLKMKCVPGDIILGSEQRGVTDSIFIGESIRK